MTYQEHFVDMLTGKPEPCEWGAWNQYLIFRLLEEDRQGLDVVRVVGEYETLRKFLKDEGRKHLIKYINEVPA